MAFSTRNLMLVFVIIGFIGGCCAQNKQVTNGANKFFRVPRGGLRRRCENQPPLVCVLNPVSSSNVSGVIRFNAVYSKIWNRFRCVVRIQAYVQGLKSNSKHGIHIHTYGDIRSTTGSSTGGHFTDPSGSKKEHGFSFSPERHWGDFDNLVANEKGIAVYDRKDTVIRIRGIIGRGITVHIGEDKGPDFQPTGGSGSRIANCVIGFANPTFTAEN